MIKNLILAGVAGIALMFTAQTASAQGVYVGPGGISVGGRGFQLQIGGYGYNPYGYNPYRYNPYQNRYNPYNPYGYNPQRYNPYQYRPPVVPNYYHPRYPHYHYHRGR